MSGTVNTIGSSSGAAYTQSLSSGAVASGSVTAQDTSTTSSAQSLFSARIVIDPVAGVITEYLDKKGDVQDQSPSSAVVAYLRAGLTAEGFSKPTAVIPATIAPATTAPSTTTSSTAASTTSTSPSTATTTNAVV